MKPEVGRRVFVGTVVAGLPVAVWKAGAFAQSGGAAAHDHAATATDPVLDHVVRQIGLIHNAAQNGPRGEHMRALAAQFRIAAVYGRQVRIDDEVRRGVQDMVDRQGRNGVLFMQPDERMRRDNLQRYGFRPERRPAPPTVEPTYQQREAALDSLLHGGVTPLFDRLATVADGIAGPLERSRARMAPVQYDAAWWQGYCEELRRQIQEAEFGAIPMCTLARYWPLAVPICGALEGGAGVLILAYLWDCTF